MTKATRIAVAGLAALILASPPARSQSSISVNTTADEYDVVPNADCSLREAVQSANAGAAFGGCVVAGAGSPFVLTVDPITYSLTLAGASEDLNATGDIDVTGIVEIVTNPPGGETTVDGGDLDRVFDLFAGSSLTLTDMVVRNGSAPQDGGGLRIIGPGAAFAATRVVIEDNETLTNGGGFFADTGVNIVISESEIRGNLADADNNGSSRGGAMYVADPGAGNTNAVLIEYSTLADNHGDEFGGAISTLGTTTTTVTIRNSTISGNTSKNGGGGISAGGPTILDGVTIVGNTSNQIATLGGGGGIRRVNGIVTLRNTIVAGNDAVMINCDDLSGTASGFVTQGANLIGENTCLEAAFAAGTPNAAGDWVGTDASPIDPLVGPLADNGGPTRTRALLAGSLALDNGNTTLPDDQRREVRDATPDIGSFEVGIPTAGAPSPAPGATHALSAVIPNPVSGVARLALSVGVSQRVEIALFDVTGRRVALIHDASTAAGPMHVIEVDCSTLSAGVYVVRVRGELFEESRRMVISR